MLKLLKYLFSFLLSIPLIPLSAQIQNTDNLFHYEMGKSSIDTSLLNNLISKQNLKSFFDELKNSTEISIKKVEITSSASMEGDVISNKRLNQKRNETVKTALMQMSGIPDSLIVCVDKGVAWDELRAVVDTSHMPYKEEVLNIIDNQPEETWKNGTLVDSRNSRLMMLRSGNPYRYMSKAYFPLFRYTKIKIVYTGELNYAEEQEMQKATDNTSLVIEIERDSTDLAQSRITPDSSASDKPQESVETIKPVESEVTVVEQQSTGTEKTQEKIRSVPRFQDQCPAAGRRNRKPRCRSSAHGPFLARFSGDLQPLHHQKRLPSQGYGIATGVPILVEKLYARTLLRSDRQFRVVQCLHVQRQPLPRYRQPPTDGIRCQLRLFVESSPLARHRIHGRCWIRKHTLRCLLQCPQRNTIQLRRQKLLGPDQSRHQHSLHFKS